ncbi:MAG: helix-turn-helix domain-containing protein [Chloroflexi bacterium]|nr:helix-turn-helix domain-containing protein [Chloroflexota bacterium]
MMGNREFGIFISALRRQHTFFDEQGVLRQWTQAELARRANLSTRQVSKVEQGAVVDLRSMLDPLAHAFQLNESEKAELYTIAGFVYSNTPKPPTHTRAALELFLRQFPYPMTARTILSDFVAFNTYYQTLFGYTTDKIRHLNEGELGPNLLRFMFDPEFDYLTYIGGESKWRKDVRLSLQFFRARTFRYIATTRYRQIIEQMKHFTAFDRLWDLSSNDPHVELGDPDGTPTRPFASVHHPEFGLLEFMPLRVPPRHFGPLLELIVLVPITAREDNYQRLRASIQQNKLYFFDERPVE